MALTKYTLTSRLGKVWRNVGRPTLSGHSFRVGGALFRHAMKVSVEDICLAGRWRLNCYQLYIRQYSVPEYDKTVEFLVFLDTAWCAVFSFARHSLVRVIRNTLVF
jgi:hypothetical protein